MKKNKLLILVVALMATLSFTACMNDDYEEQGKRKLPTVAELKAASSSIQGLYQGKLYRYDQIGNSWQFEKKDSVNTTWEVKDDTTLVIKNFPAKMLATNVIDTDLKQAIAALPNQEIKCAVSVFSVKPILFYIAPYRLDLGKITYGGKTHNVAIAFLFKADYTYGGYDTERKVFATRLLEGGLMIDGVLDQSVSKGFISFFLVSDPRV